MTDLNGFREMFNNLDAARHFGSLRHSFILLFKIRGFAALALWGVQKMEFDIISVREPVWADAKHSAINCWLRTSAHSTELPFTASPSDMEAHGRDVFRRCMSGEFGEIQPYVASQYTEDHSTSVTLPKWVSAWPEVHDFIIEANVENTKNSPRAIALVWGSMVETMLRSFIEQQLKKKDPPQQSLTYRNGKRCGTTFEALIKGACSQEMIDEELGKHLDAIREIRNACAHEWNLSRSNGKIRKLDEHLKLLRSAYFPDFLLDDFESLIKMVFSSACCRIIIQLAECSVPDDRGSIVSGT